MTTRVEDQSQMFTRTEVVSNESGTTTTRYYHPGIVYASSQAGSNTPGFHYLTRRSLPCNDYYRTVRTVTPGSFHSKDVSTWPSLSTTTVTDSFVAEPWWIPHDNPSSDSNALCIRRINERLANVDVNLAQAFAERNQIVNMFGATARRLATSFLHLRRGNWRYAINELGASYNSLPNGFVDRFNKNYRRNRFDASASAWLELQYGWKPLLSDVYGAAKLLAELPFRPPVATVRASGTTSLNLATSYVDSEIQDVSFLEVTARTGITCTYTVSNEPLQLATQVGLANPALLAWELLPYSFVVDWFLPIGDYLTHVNASNGLTFVRGSSSTKLSYKSSGYRLEHSELPDSTHDAFWLYNSVKTMQFSRALLYGFPREPLPNFKNPLSVEHFANAVALLHNAFQRFKPR